MGHGGGGGGIGGHGVGSGAGCYDDGDENMTSYAIFTTTEPFGAMMVRLKTCDVDQCELSSILVGMLKDVDFDALPAREGFIFIIPVLSIVELPNAPAFAPM